MKKLLALFVCFAVCFQSITIADDNETAIEPPRRELRIAGTQPPGRNIFFIVDTSGSMLGSTEYRVKAAIETTIQIAEVPLDDLQIAIVSFGGSTKRWPGTEDKDQSGNTITRPGWSLMPSQGNLKKAYDWLYSNIDGTDTKIEMAVDYVFQSCAEQAVSDLSIIIISDGGFFGGVGYIGLAKNIDSLQKKRQSLGLNPAALGFFGIDVGGWDPDICKLVGKEVVVDTQNKYWVADRFLLGYWTLIYGESK